MGQCNMLALFGKYEDAVAGCDGINYEWVELRVLKFQSDDFLSQQFSFNRQVIYLEFPLTSSECKLFKFDKNKVNYFQKIWSPIHWRHSLLIEPVPP